MKAAYGGRLQNADIDDILSQTYLNAWRKRGAFKAGQGELGGWLWTIALNAATDLLRRRSSRPSDSSDHLDTFASETIDEDEPLPSTDPRVQATRTFIESLNAVDRRIVSAALSESEGWTRLVADELAITPGAVRVRWLRLRERLRNRLETQENDNE